MISGWNGINGIWNPEGGMSDWDAVCRMKFAGLIDTDITRVNKAQRKRTYIDDW